LVGTFTDPNLPAGYSPFNIANIGGQLYVAYATQASPGEELPGLGLGIISVFDFGGNDVRRFTTGAEFNAPWAIVRAPANFGPFKNDLLVGNFGDGRILAYDPGTGAYLGAVLDTLGNQVAVDGLWGLAFGRAVSGAAVARRLCFAAGIEGETHGLFGYLSAVADSDTTSTPPVAACDNGSKGAGYWRKLCGGPLNGHGQGKGRGGDGHNGHGPWGDHSDSLDILFACITNNASPNAFGANGCFTAGRDLIQEVGKRTDGERAGQVLLLTRLNLCSGVVCDSLAIHREVADSLDALTCVLENEQGDNHVDDDDGRTEFMQKIAVKTGMNPMRLGDGPVHFALNANVTWDGKDLRGQAVVPGTYFYRAVATGQTATGRLLIVR